MDVAVHCELVLQTLGLTFAEPSLALVDGVVHVVVWHNKGQLYIDAESTVSTHR